MFGTTELIIILVNVPMAAFLFWCMATIARKAGFSGWWCLTFLFPPLGLVMLWVFSKARWPAIDPEPAIKSGSNPSHSPPARNNPGRV
ncbi:MAG: hypothetical protein KJ621_09315 [Proteobacteria bacterium]|nr:hypothetical protein [Pseudomonadota bacterium]MBU1740870.1 hypothetical protein [Pseudomonadota bacterium]